MAYLLDTNVVSELRKGNRCEAAVREWFDALDDDDAYLKRDPRSATRLRRWLTNLSTQFESRILPVTLPIARTWGKMGTPNPIPTVDGLLAATAHTHGLILATRNVTHIESLDIEWLNPFD
jgi:predicted nucleic acid-binding protein